MLAHTVTDLGNIIRERRHELRLRQADLADQAKVSRQWLIALESGRDGADVARVLRVFTVLGLRLDVHAAEASVEPPRIADEPDEAAALDLDAFVAMYRGGA